MICISVFIYKNPPAVQAGEHSLLHEVQVTDHASYFYQRFKGGFCASLSATLLKLKGFLF